MHREGGSSALHVSRRSLLSPPTLAYFGMRDADHALTPARLLIAREGRY